MTWCLSSWSCRERVRELTKEIIRKPYPFPKVIEDLDLDERLVMEALLIADDLDCYRFTSAVIAAMQDLTKGALAERVDDLVPISQVIAIDDEVVSTVVVVPKIVSRVLRRGLVLLAPSPDTVDRRVVDDLLALVVG
jgi:hypothetical protein